MAFLTLAAVAWWRGRSEPGVVLAAIGTALILGGLVLPGRLGPVFRAWMGLAHLLSRVTTPLFLGFVFFIVLTPIGLVMRLFGSRRPQGSAPSSGGWVTRAPDARRRTDMQRQF
jgi:hypothetical protein